MKKFLSNKEILIKNNHPIDDEIEIDQGSVLTFENSDIAFHADSIINSLREIQTPNIKKIEFTGNASKFSYRTCYLHKSPYDKSEKWLHKEIKMMYLLTKSINENVIKLLQLDIPRFLAISITGMGGTEIEPNVPNYKKVFEKIKELIDDGFDPNDIVIRIDPLYPGLNTPDVNSALLIDIVKNCKKLNIKQIYTSVFDIYKNTSKDILNKLDLKAYSDRNKHGNVIHANLSYLKSVFENIDDIIDLASDGSIEHILCGEIPESLPKYAKKIGCLNKQRIEQTLHNKVINIKDRTLDDKNVQRHFCLCAITDKGKKLKRQGLTHEDKCYHNCLGCYISNNNK